MPKFGSNNKERGEYKHKQKKEEGRKNQTSWGNHWKGKRRRGGRERKKLARDSRLGRKLRKAQGPPVCLRGTERNPGQSNKGTGKKEGPLRVKSPKRRRLKCPLKTTRTKEVKWAL